MYLSTLLAILFAWLPIAAAATTPPDQFDYAPEGTSAVTITRYKGSDKVVLIPSTIAGKTVIGIGPTAFLAATLTDVTIPNTVTNIGANAFLACSSLVNVSMPESLITLGGQAFDEC